MKNLRDADFGPVKREPEIGYSETVPLRLARLVSIASLTGLAQRGVAGEGMVEVLRTTDFLDRDPESSHQLQATIDRQSSAILALMKVLVVLKRG